MKIQTNRKFSSGRCIRCGDKTESPSRYMNDQGNICFSCLTKEASPCLLCFEDIGPDEAVHVVRDMLPEEGFDPQFLGRQRDRGTQDPTGRVEPWIEVLRRTYHLHEVREFAYDHRVCGFCGTPIAEEVNNVAALRGVKFRRLSDVDREAEEEVGRPICADCYQNSFDRVPKKLLLDKISLTALSRSLLEQWNEFRPRDHRAVVAPVQAPTGEETLPPAPEAEKPTEPPEEKRNPAREALRLRRLVDYLHRTEESGLLQELHIELVHGKSRSLEKVAGPMTLDNTGNQLFNRLFFSYLDCSSPEGLQRLHLKFPIETPMRFLLEVSTVTAGLFTLSRADFTGDRCIFSELAPFTYDGKSLEDDDYLMSFVGRALAIRMASKMLNRYFMESPTRYLREIRTRFPVLGRLIVHVNRIGEGNPDRVLPSLLTPPRLRDWMRPQLSLWEIEDTKLVLQRSEDSRE